eukprot:TRINITY_DN2725_c0_g1_i2.p2 TRINITY_DN2725_c0_g1~~TRINITY_DN2725_c0_g1_i2.p2  ORF type:complete len:116 (+),score=29.50 TRINITY_DN2725_c0_g1_i2:126-473(+)
MEGTRQTRDLVEDSSGEIRVDSYCRPGKEDRYGGVIIDESLLPKEVEEFSREMEESLTKWKEQGKRGIWLKIPAGRSELIHIAAQEKRTDTVVSSSMNLFFLRKLKNSQERWKNH